MTSDDRRTQRDGYPGPRIREVYREYELGRIPFEEVIRAAEERIAWWESRRDEGAHGEATAAAGE